MDNNIFQDSLNIVGLEDPNLCSKEKALSNILEKTKEYRKNVQRTINSLSSKSLGAFLATVTALMSQITAGGGFAILNGLVINGVFGNILGTAATMVGLVLSSLTGSFSMLQYLAVKSLKSELEKRIELGEFIDSELSQMIAFFQSISRNIEEGKQTNIDEIFEALQDVRRASIKVGSETRRTSRAGTIIDSQKINLAEKDIDYAINHLTTGGFLETTEELNKVHQAYGIEIDLGVFEIGVPNFSLAVTYFDQLFDELNRVYFSKDLTSDERRKNEQKVKEFYFKLMPILPEFMRRLAYTKTFEERGKRLFEVLPVEAKVLSKLTDKINDNVKIPDSVFSFFNTDQTPQLNDIDLPDTTYAVSTSNIQLKELAIWNLPDYMDKINIEAGVFKSILLPANNRLVNIRNEMEKVVEKSPDTAREVFNISKKKITWSKELLSIKAMLKTAIGQPLTFKGSKFFPDNETKKFRDADEVFKLLRKFIDEKEDLGTRIFILAQKHLTQLSIGSVNFFIPGALRHLLVGLQGLRKSVRDQLKIDRDELALCNEFLHILDTSPFFNNAIKPTWKALEDSITESPAARAISEDLENGDLRHVVNAIEGIQRASLIANSIRCSQGEFPTSEGADVFASIIGAGSKESSDDVSKWYKDFIEEAQQAVNTLNDEKAQLDSIRNLINNA